MTRKIIAAALHLSSNLTSLARRAVALFLISIYIVPISFLSIPTRGAIKDTPSTPPPPKSAPPTPFVVGRAPGAVENTIAALRQVYSNWRDSAIKILNKPSMPAGLGEPGAKMTATEDLSADAIEPAASMFTAPAGRKRFDFDGDGKADIGRWHAPNAEWKVLKSGTNAYSSSTLGTGAGTIAPGNFDGDTLTDPAVFNNGTWTVRLSSTNTTTTFSFGQSGDIPVAGDFDGDGLSDLAVFRPSTNSWWIKKSGDGNTVSAVFGVAGDIAAPGDYDGDSKTDIALFRPSTGDWHVTGSSAGYFVFHWGIASDIPVPADYDGDGKTDFAVYRGNSGSWYISKSSTGNTQYVTKAWGSYGDQPAPADYDGDGKDDVAVWRPTTGGWYIIRSSNGGYDYPVLGAAGDTAINSAGIKQIGGSVYSYDFASQRLSPKNATGGTNLYSRNVGWSSGLLSLPGRAGLDMGFGISYNSLVWTKDTTNNVIVFDADNSNLTPGFNFGFGRIEPAYFNAATGSFSFLMITPSGAKVEFRQTGASNVYETADSSYTQLKINNGSVSDPAENLSLTVITTDGTQSLYEWKYGAYRLQKITDRNGNYISINHDAEGKLRSVTDTLGRVVTVNYSVDGYPTSVTQDWKDNNGAGATVTRTYATFEYATMSLTGIFSTIRMGRRGPGSVTYIATIGPGEGISVKVLKKVVFPTESNGAGPGTSFDYNAFGQVTKITNTAADNHVLNYTQFGLASPDAKSPDVLASTTDCLRLFETRNWVENFNQDASGQPQETIISNSLTEGVAYDLPDGHSGTGTLLEVSMQDDPYGHISRTYVGSSGWLESLPIATEDWINQATATNPTGELPPPDTEGVPTEATLDPVRKRWTWTNWTQDDENLTTILNPRTIESKVGDESNIKRTTTEYYLQNGSPTVANFGLVKEIKVLDADQSTPIYKVYTEYNLDPSYISRRIIGLPYLRESYGLNQQTNLFEKVVKTTFQYDEGDFGNPLVNQNPASIVQHDTNFNASFIKGRGNLTSRTRYDVTGQSLPVSQSRKYNTAGSVVSQSDSLGRTIKIAYEDNYNDTITSRATFAYPTKVTDSGDHFSEAKYRFDNGANVWARSPAPVGNTSGKESARTYDLSGRLVREAVANTGAYERYAYPLNNVESVTYTTVTDMNGNNTGDFGDEMMSEKWTDGAGRLVRTKSENPNSVGGWTGTMIEYDILGRQTRVSSPTETSSSYQPSGDDSTRGWLWNRNEYDWQGRITRIVDSDSNGSDGKDKLISYEGCGCAGIQVTTIEEEEVAIPNEVGMKARRTQKSYDDILGRTFKQELLNWDGTVYTTVLKTFNGRNQEIQSIQQDNSQQGNPSQFTLFNYDGHGRLSSKHTPEQLEGTSTTFTYNPDDTVSSITDARGATTSFLFNGQGFLESIGYSAPSNSGIRAPSTVTFSYDDIGNRRAMADDLGSVTYEYTQLSQIKSETRRFTDPLPSAPISNNGFKIEYSYDLAGQLKSYQDPFGQKFEYNLDKIGRLSAVTGSTVFGGVTEYAFNSGYRAWGAQKSVSYGNNTSMQIDFDNRFLPKYYKLSNSTSALMEKSYQYYADGQIKYVQNVNDSRQDALYTYDQLKRLIGGKSAIEARGGTETDYTKLPYRVGFSYNAFGDMTGRTTQRYDDQADDAASFTNHRRYGLSPSVYDAQGNDLRYQSLYDVANEKYHQNYDGEIDITRFFDGDGREIKRGDQRWNYSLNQWNPVDYAYYIRSTVLGGNIVTEVDKDGKKSQTFVRGAGAIIATQQVTFVNSQPSEKVVWEARDPANHEVRYKDSAGLPSGGEYLSGGFYDPTGVLMGPRPLVRPDRNLTNTRERVPSAYQESTLGGYFDPGCSVTLDGILTPCDLAFGFANEHLQVEVRRGNKVATYDIQQNISGTLSVLLPVENTYVDAEAQIFPEDYEPDLSGKPFEQKYDLVSFSFNWQTNLRVSSLRQSLDVDGSYDLNRLLNDAQRVLEDPNLSDECKKLIGPDNISKFKTMRDNFSKDPKHLNVPGTSAARTIGDHTYINPTAGEFNEYVRAPRVVLKGKNLPKNYNDMVKKYNQGVSDYNKNLQDLGVSAYQYAVATIIHEFLHQINKFDPDNSADDHSESFNNQKKVIERCIRPSGVRLQERPSIGPG